MFFALFFTWFWVNVGTHVHDFFDTDFRTAFRRRFVSILIPKWLPKWPKNEPIKLPRASKRRQDATFFSKKSFWEPLARFGHFWTQAWDHFYGFGAYFISVLGSKFVGLEPILNDFHAFCDHFGLHFNIIWKIWVGRGGKAQFPKSHFSASKPLSASQPLTGTVRTCFATWITLQI